MAIENISAPPLIRLLIPVAVRKIFSIKNRMFVFYPFESAPLAMIVRHCFNDSLSLTLNEHQMQ